MLIGGGRTITTGARIVILETFGIKHYVPIPKLALKIAQLKGLNRMIGLLHMELLQFQEEFKFSLLLREHIAKISDPDPIYWMMMILTTNFI